MSRNSRKGFTLIELLVVIAIIAILAAILFPVFAKARDKARQAACLSNVKQMSLGIVMYAGDYDNTFPPLANEQPVIFPGGDAMLTNGGTSAPYSWPWQHLIYPYVKNFQVSYCPNSPTRFNQAYAAQVAWGQYGANTSVIGFCPEAPGTAALINTYGMGIKTETQIQNAADTYLIMDAGSYGVHWVNTLGGTVGGYLPGAGKILGDASWTGYYNWPTTGADYRDFMEGRHNGGVNVGFVDGHAKWTKVETMVAGARNRANHTTPDPWGDGTPHSAP